MATEPFRSPTGGRIDRGRTLRFTFNGRSLSGCEGDTLASALLAHGVRLTARSFKTFFQISTGIAFLIAVLTGPTLISADLRNNGLPLYFARPRHARLATIGFWLLAAAFGVQAHVYPKKRQFLQYTTTSPIMQQRLGVTGSEG